ncbi:uncharacterized protein LOC144508481 isoform X1 [Mustelus asterias]
MKEPSLDSDFLDSDSGFVLFLCRVDSNFLSEGTAMFLPEVYRAADIWKCHHLDVPLEDTHQPDLEIYHHYFTIDGILRSCCSEWRFGQVPNSLSSLAAADGCARPENSGHYFLIRIARKIQGKAYHFSLLQICRSSGLQ